MNERLKKRRHKNLIYLGKRPIQNDLERFFKRREIFFQNQGYMMCISINVAVLEKN